ncbi:MAG: hypothetical protein NVS4B3_18600 [Gemmatimonadaceae bacterium]
MNLAHISGLLAAPHPRARSLTVVTMTAVPACMVAALIERPGLYRGLFAVVIATVLVSVALARPELGAALTLMFLPLLALLRRLLIGQAGWSSADPLLLVGPLLAALLFVELFVIKRRPVLTGTVSKLVAGLLVLAAVETVNPLGNGLVTNLAGFLFVGIPLLWYFVGREYGSDRVVAALLRWVVGSAFVLALYGMWQVFVGFPSWDTNWLRLGGYSSLHVTAGVTRAFGTFSSSAEYAAYLSIGLLVALALTLHGRFVYSLPIPLLALAVFLESSRGPVLITFAVAICIAALRTGRGRLAFGLSLCAFAVAAGAIALAGPSIEQSAARSGNALITHQVGGILNPTDPNSSTLPSHLQLMANGVAEGIRHPLGEGTGATTIASRQLVGSQSAPLDQSGASRPNGSPTQTKNTETDFTNSFISLGALGPILLLALTFVAFRRAIRDYFTRMNASSLAVVGVLLATFGSWLNGGEYAVAPLVMFLLGSTARDEITQRVRVGDERLAVE